MIETTHKGTPPEYVMFNSQTSTLSNNEEKKSWYKYFEFTMLLTHAIGVLFLTLDGYFFGTTQGGLTWHKESTIGKLGSYPTNHSHGLLNFHGFFMTSAFIFFQGEGSCFNELISIF
uniref:Uncharacterized protein n=1 Tax=Acrobeloides nanus TaxID=290746 RepID=A0A914DTV6_9BILA